MCLTTKTTYLKVDTQNELQAFLIAVSPSTASTKVLIAGRFAVLPSGPKQTYR
jgi:hypothetical protein